MNDDMLQRLSCAHAAAEIEANLGVLALAPNVSQMVRELRACAGGDECLGTPRFLIAQEATERLAADLVLALRN